MTHSVLLSPFGSRAKRRHAVQFVNFLALPILFFRDESLQGIYEERLVQATTSSSRASHGDCHDKLDFCLGRRRAKLRPVSLGDLCVYSMQSSRITRSGASLSCCAK